MKYYWITTDLRSSILEGLFRDNDIFVISDEALEILVTAPEHTDFQKLIWNINPSAYAEIREADPDSIEEFL